MGVVVTLQMICSLHQVTHGSIEIGLDGESAFKVIFEKDPPQATKKAQDLIHTIQKAIKALQLEVMGRHIKGHQDDHVDISQLDPWARLNISVDKAAKKRLHKIRSHPQPPTRHCQENGSPCISKGRSNQK